MSWLSTIASRLRNAGQAANPLHSLTRMNYSTATPAPSDDSRSFAMSVSSNRPAVSSVPASTYDGKQGLTYFAGIAAETVGSQASACIS